MTTTLELDRANSRLFRRWAREQMDLLNMSTDPEYPADEDTWGWYVYIAGEAGDWAARLGWPDLFEKSIETGYLGNAQKLKGFLARCIEACNTRREGSPEVSTPDETATSANRKLPMRCEKAYWAYRMVEEKLGWVTDEEAYKWLTENAAEHDLELQEFHTWTRYLREARRFFDTRKNTPRHGRPHGSSIATTDQIESPYDVGRDRDFYA